MYFILFRIMFKHIIYIYMLMYASFEATLVIRVGSVPDNYRVKRETQWTNTEQGGGTGNTTEWKWWDVSGELRAQVAELAQQLLSWGTERT
jgi:hypothetical protein